MAMPEATFSETQAPKYWAFLSYSQRDKNWSDWLRRAIENYRVPRRLVGRQSRDGAVPRRLFPVFRDREELPTSANLGSNIEEALRASRYLIVVCSPNGAASRWVNEEIRAFKAMGREDRVLAIIVDGEPNASDKPDSGVPECFPKAIRYRIGADGELTQERTEPIAADVRPDRDGRHNARLKILAGLLGVGFDELRQRDRARHRRRIMLAGAAAIAVITALTGTWLLQERAKKRDVDRQLASKYEERARALATKGDEAGAALFFAEANQLDPNRARRDAALLHLQPLVLPRLTVELGEKISCAAFDPSGRRFLAMGDGGRPTDDPDKPTPANLRVWDAESGARLVEFSVDNATYSFRRAFFTRDGKRIFTALENARLWDAESGKPLGPPIPFNAIPQGGGGVIDNSYVDRAGLDPTETKVVLKWREGFVQSWNAETSQPLDKVEYRAGAWADLAFLWQDDPVPKFSPDAKISLMQSDMDPIQLVEVETGKKIGEPLRQEGNIFAAAISPKNDLAVTGGSDGTAHLWRIHDGERYSTRMIHPGVILRVKFSPDGEFILTTSGAIAYLWNKFGQLEMVMPNSADIEAATFSADGQRILTGAKDGNAFVWNVAERRMLPRAIAHDAWRDARVLVLSPDGRSLFTQGPGENGQPQIRLWDVRSGAPLWKPVEHEPSITLVNFSPDGSTIATVDHARIPRDEPYKFGEDVPEKKMLRLWDGGTGAAIGDPYEITGRSGGDSETPETVIAFSADSSRLLLVHNEFLPPVQPGGGLTAQAKLQLLDGRNGRSLREALTIRGHVTGAVFLQSGEMLFAHNDEVLSWPAGRSEPATDALIKMERILSIALSPDEKTLLTVARDQGRLWDLKSRQPIGAILQQFDLVDFAPKKKSGLTQIHNAAFSPDGRIALTTAGREVRLWDSRTGEAVGQPFPLGDVPMFGQTPRLVDGARLLSPGRGVIWDKDLSWLLRDVSPEQILSEAQLLSRRRMRSDGAPEIIPATEWKAKRR